MHFRTELQPAPAPFQLGLSTPVLTAGSCFAEAMGKRMEQYKLPVRVNPFGTVFNPVSLCRLLLLALQQKQPDPQGWVEHDAVWSHYDFHSRFSNPVREQLEADIQKILDETSEFLTRTDALILTFGTAWVYEKQHDGVLVANCHKVPAGNFRKRLLSPEEIEQAFSALHLAFRSLRPAGKIILTVSPVRHVKDTLELNQVSKSLLRYVCHRLTGQFPDLHYFPGYEIMLDDLRDYRFYQADMIHPSEVAEAYIWEKFTHTYLDPTTQAFIAQWKDIEKSLAHRPFHPGTAAHRKFLEKLLSKLSSLDLQANVTAEIAEVARRLGKIQPEE